MGGMWVTMASVSTNNKGWASPGEGQCPSGHPSFPDLALASAQSPLSHPSGWGSVQDPSLLHTSGSHHPILPENKDQPSPAPLTKPSLLVSPPTVLQPYSPRPGHVVTFSAQPRNGPRGLLSSSLCVLGSHQSHLCHTTAVPSPPTCASL